MTAFLEQYAALRRGCAERSAGGIRWVVSEELEGLGCLHGFTLRFGGVSAPPFDTLNLGYNRPEPAENVTENYRRLAAAAGFDFSTMALCNFCHGDGVETATAAQCGWGFPNHPAFPPCDALASNDPAVTLVTLHADCMPVFLYDPAKRAGAMIHAGWKGNSLRIGEKAARRLMANYGCQPKDLRAFFGPSIGPCCFEVDEPVKRVFDAAFPGLPAARWDEARGKYLVDLVMTMAAQLFDCGLPVENMQDAGRCTCCGEGFFSYRRDKKRFGKTGAMAGFLRVPPRA